MAIGARVSHEHYRKLLVQRAQCGVFAIYFFGGCTLFIYPVSCEQQRAGIFSAKQCALAVGEWFARRLYRDVWAGNSTCIDVRIYRYPGAAQEPGELPVAIEHCKNTHLSFA